MSARDHFREAERLLEMARGRVEASDARNSALFEAQVHASLAAALMNDAASRRLAKSQQRVIEWAERQASPAPVDEDSRPPEDDPS
jgi:hypothetical protein